MRVVRLNFAFITRIVTGRSRNRIEIKRRTLLRSINILLIRNTNTLVRRRSTTIVSRDANSNRTLLLTTQRNITFLTRQHVRALKRVNGITYRNTIARYLFRLLINGILARNGILASNNVRRRRVLFSMTRFLLRLLKHMVPRISLIVGSLTLMTKRPTRGGLRRNTLTTTKKANRNMFTTFLRFHIRISRSQLLFVMTRESVLSHGTFLRNERARVEGLHLTNVSNGLVRVKLTNQRKRYGFKRLIRSVVRTNTSNANTRGNNREGRVVRSRSARRSSGNRLTSNTSVNRAATSTILISNRFMLNLLRTITNYVSSTNGPFVLTGRTGRVMAYRRVLSFASTIDLTNNANYTGNSRPFTRRAEGRSRGRYSSREGRRGRPVGKYRYGSTRRRLYHEARSNRGQDPNRLLGLIRIINGLKRMLTTLLLVVLLVNLIRRTHYRVPTRDIIRPTRNPTLRRNLYGRTGSRNRPNRRGGGSPGNRDPRVAIRRSLNSLGLCRANTSLRAVNGGRASKNHYGDKPTLFRVVLRSFRLFDSHSVYLCRR